MLFILKLPPSFIIQRGRLPRQSRTGTADGRVRMGLKHPLPSERIRHMTGADELFAEANGRLTERRFADAAALYRQVIALQPNFVEAISNLGVVFAEQGRHDEALDCYNRALSIRPNSPDILFNRGNSLAALRQSADALSSFEAALAANPQFVEAWTNRGVLLRRLGYVREALECHRRALQLRPNSADTLSNFGLCLGSLGRVEEALDHYEAALRLQPNNPGARCNRAQLLLLKGDFQRGWPAYESRWGLERARIADRGLPRWDGSPRPDGTILLREEQGLGDTIMFCRYAALVKERVGRVVLECPKRIHRLLAAVAGIDAFVDPREAVEGIACEAPLLSLPGIFRTNFRTIPAKAPYLCAEADRVERWRERLPKDGFHIGIAWQGNPDFPEDAMRSLPLRHFAALTFPGTRLISLQKGPGAEQITPLASRVSVIELGSDLDADGAFLDTAAIMMHLDLVITSDTAVAHLAGALGRPVWIALSTGPEWRWLRDRDDSPWYPTARLFRQRQFGDWDTVFAEMREELERII